MYGLGRVHSPDDRDNKFPLSERLPVEQARNTWKYWWADGWWGNQHETEQCTAYSWLHWVSDGPVKHPKDKSPVENPVSFYEKEQVIDGLPLPHQGSTVRAGAKILKSQNFILSYHWAQNIEDIKACLLTTGPLVVGTLWTTDMLTPNPKGIIRPTGNSAGGHAYVLDGINLGKGLLRIKNSWGREWGKKGFAYIPISDFALLLTDHGEACLAIENPLI